MNRREKQARKHRRRSALRSAQQAKAMDSVHRVQKALDLRPEAGGFRINIPHTVGFAAGSLFAIRERIDMLAQRAGVSFDEMVAMIREEAPTAAAREFADSFETHEYMWAVIQEKGLVGEGWERWVRHSNAASTS